MKDYYLILGLEPNCTTEEVKKAYKQMSFKYHPDRNKGDKYFEERFKDINEGYEILSDIELRKQYDYQWLNSQKTTNDDQNRFNEASKTKEEELLKRESMLEKRENELLKRESSVESKEGKWPLILFGVIAFSFVICLVIYNMSKSNVDGISKDKMSSLEFRIKQMEQDNSNLISERDLLRIQVSDLEGKIKHPKSVVSVFDLSEKKQAVKENEPPKSRKLIINNTKEVELLNLEWYDTGGEPFTLVGVSVYNKTDSHITSVKVSWEVNDSKGRPINSGEFVTWIFGDQKSIPPKKAVKCLLTGDAPEKRESDALVMTISDYKIQ